MTPEEALRKIWEYRGLCWHEWDKGRELYDEGWFEYFKECKHCKKRHYGMDAGLPKNPDPNDWYIFGEVWTWAKGEEWFQEFIGCYHGSADVDLGLLVEVDLIGPALFPEVAEFLEGRK